MLKGIFETHRSQTDLKLVDCIYCIAQQIVSLSTLLLAHVFYAMFLSKIHQEFTIQKEPFICDSFESRKQEESSAHKIRFLRMIPRSKWQEMSCREVIQLLKLCDQHRNAATHFRQLTSHMVYKGKLRDRLEIRLRTFSFQEYVLDER